MIYTLAASSNSRTLAECTLHIAFSANLCTHIHQLDSQVAPSIVYDTTELYVLAITSLGTGRIYKYVNYG